MAESTSTYFIEEKYVLCSECSNCWVENDPRILSCQHTFCFKCLENSNIGNNSKIDCPQCKSKTIVPSGKISNLNINLSKHILRRTINLCPKHYKDCLLYCKTHKIEKLCWKCIEDNHFTCKISTMKMQFENSQLKIFVCKLLKDKKKALIQEIKDKEKNILEIIQKEFYSNLTYLNMIFEEKENQVTKLIDEFVNKEKIKDELNSNFQIGLLDNVELIYTDIKLFECENNTLEIPKEMINDNNTNFDKDSFLEIANSINIPCKFLEETDLKNQILSRLIIQPSFYPTLILFTVKFQQSTKEENISFEKYRLSEANSDKFNNLLTKFQSITSLYIVSNVNRNFEIFEDFFNNLKLSIKYLTNFSCINCELDENQAKILGKYFSLYCHNLVKINLSFNDNISNGFQDIFKGLQNSCQSLSTIDLSFCSLDIQHCHFLSKLIEKCKIERINLSSNVRMETGFFVICKALAKSSNYLEEIILSNCKLTEDDCQNFGIILEKCNNIKTIDVSFNAIVRNRLKFICNGLKNSSGTLKKINLSDIGLNSNDGKELGNFLAHCSSIEYLSLERNTDLENGFTSVFYGLKKSSNTLRQLNLFSTAITNQYWTALENCLINCTQLEIFSISFNQLPSDKSLFDLAKCFQKSKHCLKEITIHLNYLNASQLKNIEKLLSSCDHLEKFEALTPYLVGNFDISTMLSKSTKYLTKLNISPFSLNEEMCSNLSNLLKKCQKIETISVYTKDTLQGLKDICDGLVQSSNTLKSINILYDNQNINKTKIMIDFLSKCQNLQILTISWSSAFAKSDYKFFSTLKELSIYFLENCTENNSLRDFLKNFTNLEFLQLYGIKGNEFILNNLIESLKNSYKTLKKFLMPKCEFTEIQLKSIKDSLDICSALNHMNLAIRVTSCGDMGEFLQRQLAKSRENTATLFLCDLNLDTKRCMILSEIFRYLVKIELINLNYNPNMGDGLTSILKSLKLNSAHLKSIELESISLAKDQIIALADLISECRKLEIINLARNAAVGNYMDILCKSLEKNNKSLGYLSLANCGLYEKGCDNLAELCRKCYRLEKIILTSNRSIGKAFINLFKSLKNSHQTLSTIILNDCNLGNEELFSLFKLFEECNNLQTIFLQGIPILMIHLPLLFQSLKKSAETLQKLDVQGSFTDDHRYVRQYSQYIPYAKIYVNAFQLIQNGAISNF